MARDGMPRQGLEEEPVHAQRGGLLPDEGAPEEHETGGALHPEEVDDGPLVPETVIVDLNSRRLVPVRAFEDDDEDGGDADEQDEEDGEEHAPAVPPRAEDREPPPLEVREVSYTYPGASAHVGLLAPHAGASLLFTRPPGGDASEDAGGFETDGTPVAQAKRVTDRRTGKVGHWATWHGTHVFVTTDGEVYLGGSPLEEASERQSIDRGMAERQEAATRHYTRERPHQVVGEGQRPTPIGELPPAQEEDLPFYERAPGGVVPEGPGRKKLKGKGLKMRLPGTEGQTEPPSATERRAGRGEVAARTRSQKGVYGAEIEHGRVLRDYSGTHAVRRRDVDRVLHYFDGASEEERRGGAEWYPAARALAERWATLADLPLSRVAAIIAAASPQTPWDNPSAINNLQQAHDCIFYKRCRHFQDSPEKRPETGRRTDPATGEVRWHNPVTAGGKMQALRDGTPPDQALSGSKIWNFYLNIMGLKTGTAVTIDRHMLSIVGAESGNPTEAKYDQYARTVGAAARERGVAPEVMQAVAWLNYQKNQAPQEAARRRAERLRGKREARQRELGLPVPAQEPPAQKRGPGKKKHLAPPGVLPRGAAAAAQQLVDRGHYEPQQQEELEQALRRKSRTGSFVPPRAREEPVKEAYAPRPDTRGAPATEQEEPQGAQEEPQRRGWLTIRREVEGEEGKPEEQETHVYVGQDGVILSGPDHLIGRELSDLRGEGTIEGQQQKGVRSDPYSYVGRQAGPPRFRETGKVMQGDEGREGDTWLSHEKSKVLYQPADHLNSLVHRGFMGPGEARELLELAYADRADRAEREKGL